MSPIELINRPLQAVKAINRDQWFALVVFFVGLYMIAGIILMSESTSTTLALIWVGVLVTNIGTWYFTLMTTVHRDRIDAAREERKLEREFRKTQQKLAKQHRNGM